MQIKSAKDLKVYQKAYALAMEIFQLSKFWPSEEKYSLTDQIRRASRSVCTNLREAWAKRRYEAHFISKLTDSESYEHIFAMLNAMEKKVDSFCPPSS